jgi:hypothetical protein
MAPTLIIVHLNCCIIIAYRKTCANRRRMVKKPTPTSTPATGSRNQSSLTTITYTR